MTGRATTAIITGASSRLGDALARDLSAHGWQLILHANANKTKADQLAQELPTSSAVITSDLTNPDDLASFIDRASVPYGLPDILINNASIFEDDGIGSLDPALFDAHFAIHTKAPLFLSNDMATRLAADKRAMIVNVIDQRVWKLTPQAMSYTLSKSALWSATQVLAQALAPRIRVNAIGPGPSFKNERQSQEEFDKQTGAVPLGRGPNPDSFGRTVRYLWDSPSVTGQMIALDGGQHLAWQTPDVIGVGE
ncbi:SDR family oxidoreductase [Roseibium algae]|uniref:SDR family oxidoreductase n=1 Tax=Roseibium algae TaxID=3123038 RepID=A0ABU8TER9_9HYPH